MESLHNITNNINNIIYIILLYSLLFSCFRSQPLLPEEEVQTLQIISLQLQNIYWNLSRSSCTNIGDFNVTFGFNIFSKLNCDCSFNNNSVCHVTRIQLKGLNLTGELPAEFANLNYLGDINLSHNYISRTIPKAFGQLSVVFLSLLGNRIHGLIPPELANVTTLQELFLEDNLPEGPIPQNFGSLIGLSRFVVSANKLNGTIPETFGNLRNLTDFRIDGNELSGKIPDFIGNWTNITRLDLQGTGLEVPIPLSIYRLKNLIELRISVLSGTNSTIPDLKDMQSMHVLILRNCLLNGAIPEYIGGFSQLKTLDLSFNRLTGQIPDSMAALNDLLLKYLYWNNNSLTGEIPSWISGSKENLNLVSSMSSSKNNSVAWCLKKDLPCSRKLQFFRKNFNIAEEAKGFGKGITLDNDVTVDNGTLEIRLYWAGKGTTLVPDRGVNGPLISAITVTPSQYILKLLPPFMSRNHSLLVDFHVETDGTLSTGTIAGIVVGSLASVILILLVLWRKRFLGEKRPRR